MNWMFSVCTFYAVACDTEFGSTIQTKNTRRLNVNKIVYQAKHSSCNFLVSISLCSWKIDEMWVGLEAKVWTRLNVRRRQGKQEEWVIISFTTLEPS